ncbi:MAG TPA: TldD/PmbA family protein [Candidatus Obscuribacterales bacterium]
MITEKQAKKIIDLALSHARGKADGAEVHVMASDVATSRFANNGMTQNQAPSAVTVSVRVLVDGRQARLSGNQTSAQAVRQLVDNAISAARLLERDPNLLPLHKPTGDDGARNVARFDRKTAVMSPDQRAERIASIIDVARSHDLSAAGTFSSGANVLALGNSEGLFAFHRESEAECSITMTARDSSGWAKAHSPQAAMIDSEAMARRAAEKALASRNPGEIEPGKYTVILEPSAVLDLLVFLWYDFAGTSHLDQLSCFLNKVGQKVLGSNMTIHDDVYHALQAGAPFDGEGLPRQVITLVENGVVKNLVYGRRSAGKFGVAPTGHGVMEPSAMGEYPLNIVIAGGSTSIDEMIAATDRGILLTRVWYVREVDPATKIVTGMTRDGTFLVEGGKIKQGVKNLRFNVSLIEMLNNVVALGPSLRTAGEEGFPAVVPAMKVDNFNFSSTTRF